MIIIVGMCVCVCMSVQGNNNLGKKHYETRREESILFQRSWCIPRIYNEIDGWMKVRMLHDDVY